MAISFEERLLGYFRIALIGSVLLSGLAGCGGGSSQPVSVASNLTDIDTSYGNQGQATFPLGVQYGGVGPSVLQADGKLVIAGWRITGPLSPFAPKQLYVLRLNGDGSPDASFGVGGEVRFNVKGSDTPANIALQPDGKIMLVVNSIEPCTVDPSVGLLNPCRTSSGGAASLVFALVRLTPQGALDSTFGGAIVGTGFESTGSSLAVQADGKILFLHSANSVRANVFGSRLARYNLDGTPDATFNQGDPIISQCASDGNAIAVQANGRIVVGGTANNVYYADPAANRGLCLERINADGSHDSSFRTADLWTKFDLNVPQLKSLTTLTNGGLLAVALAHDGTAFGVVASRYDANGVLDTKFGVGGIAKLVIDKAFRLTNYVVTPVGDLMIFGFLTTSSVTGQAKQYQPIWIRLNINGQPESGFGTEGILSGPSDTKLPQDFLQDEEGRWLVINSSFMPDGNLEIVVTRLRGDQFAK